MPVVLIGTLDTKGAELQFVRDLLNQAGVETRVIDAGVLKPPLFSPDVSREQVYEAAGANLAAIQRANDRGRAIEAAAKGVTKILLDFLANGQVDGVLSLGGSAGTTIGTAAMRALPFGIPKLMVSTLASGQVKQWVGVRDILMLHSVVDISGLNRISRAVLTNAALAMAGMVQGREIAGPLADVTKPDSASAADKPLITATMFGVTTPCVEVARTLLEQNGYEVLVFHATGTGGMTMESFIADGLIAGVLDITTTELADEQVGGILTRGQRSFNGSGSAPCTTGYLSRCIGHGEFRTCGDGSREVARPALLSA